MALYQEGQIWEWNGKVYIIDHVWMYDVAGELRTVGKMRRIDESDKPELITIDVNFSHEAKNLTFIGQIPLDTYYKLVTERWREETDDIEGFTACPMEEATHVIFSKAGLKMVNEDGKGLTPYKVYPISRDPESGEYLIIDDNEDVIIGFDLFIPCEYLKRNSPDGEWRGEEKPRKKRKNNIIIFPLNGKATQQ